LKRKNTLKDSCDSGNDGRLVLIYSFHIRFTFGIRAR